MRDSIRRRSLPLLDASGAAEFPSGAALPPAQGLERREWLKLLAAGLALAGAGGCTQRRREKILPYADRPPELTPGRPVHYATSMVLDGYATGLLVESHEGRPTKIEGNPEHPASLGATGVYEQASVLELYDPSRLRGVWRSGSPAAWSDALAELGRALSRAEPPWFVLYPQSSPSLAAAIDRIRERYRGARFVFHSPVDRRSAYEASRRLFGRPLDVQYRFERARVVVALDADFLAAMPMSVRWARDFAAARRPTAPGSGTNRLYVAEAMSSCTGSLADHRLPVRPSDVPQVAAAVLAGVLAAGSLAGGAPAELRAELGRGQAFANQAWTRAALRDLLAARGASIVLAGDDQPPEAHILAQALNLALGNFGRTVFLTESSLLAPHGGDSLADLTVAAASGEVGAVVIADANPVLTASADLDLPRALRRAAQSFHLTLYDNETSRACGWVLPLAHYLESWGDARAYDGTLSYVQPLIEPLYGGRTVAELFAAALGEPASGYELLRRHERGTLSAAAFEPQWEERVQRGFVPGSEFAELQAEPRWNVVAEALTITAEAAPAPRIELNPKPSPSVLDGRFANNGWLLELPHPITKQTWGNAALLGPATAAALGVETGRVLELSARGRRTRVPALVLPGHAEGALTVELGYGRAGSEELARGVGCNLYPLLPPDTAARAEAVTVKPLASVEALAVAQHTTSLHARPLALHATLSELAAQPELFREYRAPRPSWLPEHEARGTQWAMTIDTTICTGCSSCVVACQAENNVPVVGKAGVLRARQMHWLRIDRYFVERDGAPPLVLQQPMLCQHCEQAPCEYVCPVNATVHSPDGLNEMVYNRCVGTRFCSNNCPYKVRRFNWFDYSENPGTRRMQKNPSVTVRERGVMEKCTFCVQRIRRAEIQARGEHRPIGAGEVLTACQQACPTRAIQFGSLEHEQTDMVRWRHDPRSYGVLHDLDTRPRVLYLAKLLNPEPEYGT